MCASACACACACACRTYPFQPLASASPCSPRGQQYNNTNDNNSNNNNTNDNIIIINTTTNNNNDNDNDDNNNNNNDNDKTNNDKLPPRTTVSTSPTGRRPEQSKGGNGQAQVQMPLGPEFSQVARCLCLWTTSFNLCIELSGMHSERSCGILSTVYQTSCPKSRTSMR